MIIRILGEGQLQVDEAVMDELQRLDDELSASVQNNDEAGFRATLDALLSKARSAGTPLPADDIEPSQAILPNADATIEEVRELLAGSTDAGLIPG
jgi:hypothetical protein